MLKIKDFFRDGGWAFVLLSVLFALFGVCDASALSADVVSPDGGGAVNIGHENSVTEGRENSPHLFLDTIDEKVTVIRPHDVVLDTISRHVTDVRNSNNQVIRHYAIDTIPLMSKVKTQVGDGTTAQVTVDTENNSLFAVDQTVIAVGVKGFKPDGATPDTENDLMLYVIDKDNSGKLICVTPNGKTHGGTANCIPQLAQNTVLCRAGRAGGESQIRTDAYSGIPTDFEQYLQKFMAEIEETTLMKMADKEVEWNFSDQEEEAIYDMKRTQNISFWRGVKGRIKVKNAHMKKAQDVYFTKGIWSQAGKDFSFGGQPVDVKNTVALMKTSFTGNSSSKRKLLICGSDVVEAFEKVDYNRVVYPGTKAQAYGLEFGTIVSKFGTLMTVHDQTLDDLGMADKAFVLDADFLRKWTMGWRVNDFDLKKAGESDSDARSLIEICGLVLKNPDAHVRVSLK